jgi:peptidoglycan hydrolase-like protein with peptidoglycan-binding domain
LNTITVTGRDAAGNLSTDTIAITYTPVIVDTQVPTTPANLTGTAISTSQINLSWTASTDNIGVTGYKVFASGTQVATTTTTTYSHTNLSPFTTYSYTISAYDAAGKTSALSSPISVTTQAQTTSPPPASSSGGTISSGGTTSGGTTTTTGGGTTTTSGTTPSSGTTQRGGGLSSAQISAILQLLQSFGADQSVITNVQTILMGGTPTTPSVTTPLAAVSFQINLYFGIKSGDVTKLQQFLAKDLSVYPEGLITGYYGALTVNAVKRFQLKYSIVSSGTAATTGYGAVGPKTRAKLNELGAGR